MYTPLGFSCRALLPRVYTCQSVLRISESPGVLLCWKPKYQHSTWGVCFSTHLFPLPWKQLLEFFMDTYQSFTVLLFLKQRLSIWRTGDSPLKQLCLTDWCGGQSISLPLKTPLRQKPGVRRFDIHRPGNLCHQHILCRVRMITAY